MSRTTVNWDYFPEPLMTDEAADDLLSEMIERYEAVLARLWYLSDGEGGYIWQQIVEGLTTAGAIISAPPLKPVRSSSRRSLGIQKVTSVLIRDDCRCVRCGAREDLTIDHIVPVSKGGTDWIVNLQVMCRSCNSKKGVKV
jgi:hypothetical protein